MWQGLAEMFQGKWEIVPFCPAYEKMLEKAKEAVRLPETSEGQNRSISGKFFSYFDETVQGRMLEILTRDLYIPQEIVNITDL